MPVLAVALPGLSIGCKHSLNKKLALYFIAPFGLLAAALGYPQHHSEAVVTGTLGGVATVVLAATWKPMAPHRLPFNLGGGALMLVSQYMGDRLAKARVEAGAACGCCKGHGHSHQNHHHAHE